MDPSQKLQWLRRVLLTKVIVTFLFWGLPPLLATPEIAAMVNVTLPEDPVFVRLFGAVVIAFGVAYWYAYRDPVRNVAILKAGVVDNGMVTLTLLVMALTRGLSSWTLWVSMVLTAGFCTAFLVLMPKETEESHA
ncbi:MAG: hypothetical protein JXA21_17255 [Anaerolineae bacterium]|nr:hypothetical protein [Anaerolineae bacterium]